MPPLFGSSILAPVLSALTALGIVLILLRTRIGALDHPNERSLHTVAVPRTGGIAIVVGILLAGLWLKTLLLICGIAVGLGVVSYYDDRHNLPAILRLAAHLAAAAIFVSQSGYEFGLPVTIFLLLGIGWLINLYNFMDGADGLAGGMTVIGFSAYGIAAMLAGNVTFGLFCFSVAASALAFLLFNFPPARIFMGDVGSIPLGFLAGALGVVGWQLSIWSWWFPVIVFLPFVLDASATLARRILRGEKFWLAHRSHYYQKLILSGWSHRNTALLEYALMLVCASVGLACIGRSGIVVWLAVAMVSIILISAARMVDSKSTVQVR
jgi:UDP-N-acetylmuramyl pentapeptide phosphotransferase/UDP-N-acetylglucosamine-1-phosphate transferase